MDAGVEPRRRGRPRSTDADVAILTAAIEALGEVGYTHLSIEDVAARAGVSKSTIYRRYPSKISLVVAAATHNREILRSKIDTGSFRGDLIAMTNLAGDLLVGSIWGRILPGVLADAADDAEVAAAVREFFTWRQVEIAAAVSRAIARGEVRAGTDSELVFELSSGPILVRLMVTGLPFEGVWVDQLVDQILEGVRAGRR
jgi:AcrR family transcriptional regulator